MTKENKNFTPLPKEVFLAKSIVDEQGHGLFTRKDINLEQDLGVTHFKIKKSYLVRGKSKEGESYDPSEQFPDSLIRTPLGAFLNHSDKPNCRLVNRGGYYSLKTLQEVKPNQELTVSYDDSPCGYSNDL